MAMAKRVKEIHFEMTNRVGLLSGVTGVLAKAKVNIAAICAYEMEKKGYFMLTVDSNAKARRVLGTLGVKIEENDAVSVEVPNRVGELGKVARKIADAGIDIEYVYATVGTGKTATCIFRTANDKKAIKVINR
jgi:hypothetical protein